MVGLIIVCVLVANIPANRLRVNQYVFWHFLNIFYVIFSEGLNGFSIASGAIRPLISLENIPHTVHRVNRHKNHNYPQPIEKVTSPIRKNPLNYLRICAM
jgi:hypothetical protein